jgi:hypothetical protein
LSIPETDDDLDLDWLGLEAGCLPEFWLRDEACAEEAEIGADDLTDYRETLALKSPDDEDGAPADFSIRIEEA